MTACGVEGGGAALRWQLQMSGSLGRVCFAAGRGVDPSERCRAGAERVGNG